jgi:acetamidase/formamidase
MGGNTDIRQLVKGSRVQLPVYVEGAKFSAGDGHMAQGDGEVSGTGLETLMSVTLRFGVIKNINCLERLTDNTGQIATPLRVQPQQLPDGVPRRGRHWSWNLRPRRARPAPDGNGRRIPQRPAGPDRRSVQHDL